MARRGHRAITIGRFTLTSAATMSLLLAGCNDEDRLSDTVVREGNRLVAATGAGAAAPPVEVRARTYATVIQALQDALNGSEKEPGAGAARFLIAQAMVGQADIASENAALAQRDVLYKLAETRSRLDLHADRTSYAGALGVYDPQADLAQLDAAQAEIERDLARERAALAENQKRIEALKRQMDDERAKTDARAAEAAQVRAEAADAEGMRRATMIGRAHEIERAAASHERRFAELQLTANALGDEAKMGRIQIASHQRREELVREARHRIESSGRLLDDESRKADLDARDLGSELGGAFDALLEMLDQQVKPAFEEASTKYRSAVSQAQQARGDMGSTAAALATTAQHSSANLHRATAEVYASVGAVGERLARALGSDRFAEAARTLRQQHDEMLAEAAGLYDSAGYSDFAGTLRGELPRQAPPAPDDGADGGEGEAAPVVESAEDVPE